MSEPRKRRSSIWERGGAFYGHKQKLMYERGPFWVSAPCKQNPCKMMSWSPRGQIRLHRTHVAFLDAWCNLRTARQHAAQETNHSSGFMSHSVDMVGCNLYCLWLRCQALSGDPMTALSPASKETQLVARHWATWWILAEICRHAVPSQRFLLSFSHSSPQEITQRQDWQQIEKQAVHRRQSAMAGHCQWQWYREFARNNVTMDALTSGQLDNVHRQVHTRQEFLESNGMSSKRQWVCLSVISSFNHSQGLLEMIHTGHPGDFRCIYVINNNHVVQVHWPRGSIVTLI